MQDHPIVGEVRTVGLLAAFELVGDKNSRAPLAPENAGTIATRDTAVRNGLMVRAVGDALISAPPFICSNEEIDILFDRLTIALDQTAASYGIKG